MPSPLSEDASPYELLLLNIAFNEDFNESRGLMGTDFRSFVGIDSTELFAGCTLDCLPIDAHLLRSCISISIGVSFIPLSCGGKRGISIVKAVALFDNPGLIG